MATMFDVSQQKLVENLKEELKNFEDINPPEWAPVVKTGAHKERRPSQQDWWYFRSASVLRVVAIRGPIGVSKLTKRYGCKKNRGVRPEKFVTASGNILRKVLQQLEKAGLIKKTEKGVRKGRVISPSGQKLLDKAANAVPKKEPVKEKPAKKPEADKPKQQKAQEKPKEIETKKEEKKQVEDKTEEKDKQKAVVPAENE